jgi:SAM-dependent methyltransferase
MPILPRKTGFPLENFDMEVAENDAMFTTLEHYVRVGLSALKVIDYAMECGFTQPSDLQSILDLPCGHGRVARALRSRFPDAELTVCDIDHDGVDFCVKKFNARGVYGTSDFEALDLGKQFDLIWVGSLITHFGADQTIRCIRCMTRHLAYDGLLILTSHGKNTVRHKVVAKIRSSFHYSSGKKRRIPIAAVLNNTLTRYRAVQNVNYQYHTTGYGFERYPDCQDQEYGYSIIARQWFEGFFAGEAYRIVAYLERGWDDFQDVLFVKTKQKGKMS